MLALTSVWIGLASLALSAAMVVYRPAFTDLTVTLVLYFGSPGAMCFAGLVLWAYRKEVGADPGIAAQRKQATVAIVLALLAAAIVYLLVIFSHKLESIEDLPSGAYNPPLGGAMVVSVL
jgi:heme/copper-type cytochrome/quinol oxidase subunit 2